MLLVQHSKDPKVLLLGNPVLTPKENRGDNDDKMEVDATPTKTKEKAYAALVQEVMG